jgi:hypothetical protein
MTNDDDRLIPVFELLKEKAPTEVRADHKVELETDLMNLHNDLKRQRMPRFAKVAAVLVFCLLATGVAEATTGVVSRVARKFLVEVKVDGQEEPVVIEMTVVPDSQ